MSFYQVTLNQGRTDTVVVEADSLNDVKTFFKAVSTANVTSVKKIVYSQKYGIGTTINTVYKSGNQNRFLKVLVKTEQGFSATLNVSFPLKSLTKEEIIKTVKKNLLLNDDEITRILNIVVSKKD